MPSSIEPRMSPRTSRSSSPTRTDSSSDRWIRSARARSRSTLRRETANGSTASVRAATLATPVHLGSIPSPHIDGHAGLYAFGAATMPDGSVIVGDYWNGRVLHYAQDGTPLGVLFSIVQPGQAVTPNTAPYGLAVAADGTVYVGTYYIDPKIPS